MTEEEIKRLNFYSKYSRANNRQSIESLYSLISGAQSASTLQIQIATQPQAKQKSVRKASASPKKAKKLVYAKPVHTEPSEPAVEQFILTQQLSNKLEQLKKLQDQFHQQMIVRERQARRRKEQAQQLKRSKLNQHPISVVDQKDDCSPRKSSVELKLKKSIHQDHVVKRVSEDDLDFQDYYMDCPEVPINQEYDHINERQKIKDMLEFQKLRQQQVQSVDEECEKTDSIVIGRLDITGKALEEEQNYPENQDYEKQYSQKSEGKQEVQVNLEAQLQPKTSIEVQDSSQQQVDSECEHMEVGKQLNRWQLSKNGPPKQVESMQNIPEDSLQAHLNVLPKDPLPEVTPAQSQLIEEDAYNLDIPLHPSGNVPPRPITNRTVTDQGSQFRDEIADHVDPIQRKSDVLHKSEGQPRPIYYSQTTNQQISLGRQVQSIPGSPDYSPIDSFNEITNRQKQLEHRKSSFKRLMAQNRANLVPRMAISTILNEHINEALVDFKSQPQHVNSGSSPQLKESMVQSEISPPSSKKKINFKKRIVEKEKDKSYSRQSKPIFERDPLKIQKNQKLLAGFFQDN